MADTLTVRIYNVRFGDAILVTVPDRDPKSGKTKLRRILIDVGNAPAGTGTDKGGEDTVFEPVIADILDTLGGNPLDLYVMTHEHLDHVQGLFYAMAKLPSLDIANRLKVDHVWLTASSKPDYYDTHPDAQKKKREFAETYRRLAAFLQLDAASVSPGLAVLLANNDPTKTTQCVDFLRGLNPAKTSFVYRGAEIAANNPFREAKIVIWAPEEDTSEYYGAFRPLDAGTMRACDAAAKGAEAVPQPLPPPGVDLGAFLNLVESRRGGVADNLLAIDKAANNTSIVFSLEWRGWRLLFAGDAEVRSWKTMHKEEVLKPVHFLKVAHHGSHNGTPDDDILNAILPEKPIDERKRFSAISTWTGTYGGIPHDPTNARLAARTTLLSTLDDPEKLYFDIEFPG